MNLKFNIKQIVLCGIFAAVTAVLAPISFVLPISPVAFSLSYFAVFLCGGFLRPGLAVTAQIIYISIGAAGLPVFSGYKGGVQILAGYTGGYILAYPLMALIISLAVKYSGGLKKPVFARVLAASMIAAALLGYILGTLWFSVVMNMTFVKSFSVAVLPFILYDSVKIAAAVPVVILVGDRLRRLNYIQT